MKIDNYENIHYLESSVFSAEDLLTITNVTVDGIITQCIVGIEDERDIDGDQSVG
jgi:hypothetical protein